MKDWLLHHFSVRGALSRRFTSSEFLLASAGIALFSHPWAIVGCAVGYFATRAAKKFGRPDTEQGSGFLTTEFLVLLGSVYRIQAAGDLPLAVLFIGFMAARGAVKFKRRQPRQEIHI